MLSTSISLFHSSDIYSYASTSQSGFNFFFLLSIAYTKHSTVTHMLCWLDHHDDGTWNYYSLQFVLLLKCLLSQTTHPMNQRPRSAVDLYVHLEYALSQEQTEYLSYLLIISNPESEYVWHDNHFERLSAETASERACSQFYQLFQSIFWKSCVQKPIPKSLIITLPHCDVSIFRVRKISNGWDKKQRTCTQELVVNATSTSCKQHSGSLTPWMWSLTPKYEEIKELSHDMTKWSVAQICSTVSMFWLHRSL